MFLSQTSESLAWSRLESADGPEQQLLSRKPDILKRLIEFDDVRMIHHLHDGNLLWQPRTFPTSLPSQACAHDRSACLKRSMFFI